MIEDDDFSVLVASGAHRLPVIESELEVIQKQLARLPTRRGLPATALGIIFATMMLTTLSLLFSEVVDKI